MQYSIVYYSEIKKVLDCRMDAEYWHPAFLQNGKLLKRLVCVKLDEISSIQFGTTPSGANFKNEGVPFVRSQDFANGYIDTGNIVYISSEEHLEQIKSSLRKNDILIAAVGATIGAIGLCAINEGNFNQNIARIRLGGEHSLKVFPEFLFVFLRGRFGQYQLGKLNTGNAQSYLNTSNISSIIVGVLRETFQKEISKIVRKSFLKIEQAQHSYHQAEGILLGELGVGGWEPRHCLSFVKNYSDTQQARRMDADYFQPKYEEIIHAIQSYPGGYDTLGSLANVKDAKHQPKNKSAYQYIELANIGGNGEITGCMREEGQNLPTRARRKVSARDIIVSSIEGSLDSIAFIGTEYDNALCSTGFYVVNSKNMNSETLLVLLKSTIGQQQLKKGCSGTILTAISKDEFSKIVLPKIRVETQTEIRRKVAESFALRRRSKHLLECAKRAVELAIEQDEKSALAWLKAQTK